MLVTSLSPQFGTRHNSNGGADEGGPARKLKPIPLGWGVVTADGDTINLTQPVESNTPVVHKPTEDAEYAASTTIPGSNLPQPDALTLALQNEALYGDPVPEHLKPQQVERAPFTKTSASNDNVGSTAKKRGVIYNSFMNGVLGWTTALVATGAGVWYAGAKQGFEDATRPLRDLQQFKQFINGDESSQRRRLFPAKVRANTPASLKNGFQTEPLPMLEPGVRANQGAILPLQPIKGRIINPQTQPLPKVELGEPASFPIYTPANPTEIFNAPRPTLEQEIKSKAPAKTRKGKGPTFNPHRHGINYHYVAGLFKKMTRRRDVA